MSQELYLQGIQSFVPSKDDNPDCVPFYRAWKGMETVLGKDTMSHWHHLLHEAIITGSYKPDSEQYTTIIQHLRYMTTRWTKPEEPRYYHSYACAPSEPTEEDARTFFNSEYKLAFPGKRANSKEANRLWTEKRTQAFSILQEQYGKDLAAFEAREAESDARIARTKQEWIDKFWDGAKFEEFVRSLESEQVCLSNLVNGLR